MKIEFPKNVFTPSLIFRILSTIRTFQKNQELSYHISSQINNLPLENHLKIKIVTLLTF